MKKIYFTLIVALMLNPLVHAGVLQKHLLQSVRQEIKENKLKFCESYEDFEECKEDPPAGPDGPIDDGEGRGGDDVPGPDDTGDGL